MGCLEAVVDGGSILSIRGWASTAQRQSMSYQRRGGEFVTTFGSLAEHVKGDIEIIDDDPRSYVFSNVFDVASRSAPYEKVVVAKNGQYVIETLRAEGTSDWFAASHDEFALVMDGCVEIELVKLDFPATVVPPERSGSVRLAGAPVGRNMGFLRLKRGHQALLPQRAAYRFRVAAGVGVIVLQTLLGPCSVQKWAEICRS